MSSTLPGRHRAPSRPFVTPLARASAALVASGALALSMSGGAQAAPAPARPVPVPAAPVTLPTTPVTLPATPVVSHPTDSITWNNVRWGARGSTVESIQRIVGVDADGVFGPITHAAVKTWQSHNGLVSDGIVGPLTARAMGLISSSATQSSSATSATQAQAAVGSRTQTSASRTEHRSQVAPQAQRPAAPQPAAQPVPRSASGAVGIASGLMGIPYAWAGSSPSVGFDCSGFTSYVYAQLGITLPRSAATQQAFATPVSTPLPGDLVFFGSPAWHVGIYAGNGMIYQATNPGSVSNYMAISSIYGSVSGYGRVG